MTATLVGVIGIIALIVLILLGIPIAFSLLAVGVTGFACLTSPTAALSLLAKDTFLTISSYSFAVLPLFFLMGRSLFRSA